MPVKVRKWIAPALASPDFVLESEPPAQPHSRVVVERAICFAGGADTEANWPTREARGSASVPKTKFAADSALEEERFEPSVPLGRERPKRSIEAVSVQITIAPSGARSLAAARLCSPSLSSLRRAVRCAKHIYI